VSILKKALRIISILIGVLSFVTAMRFAFAPDGAAARLGMPLLEGVGASTQLGDIGALFLAVAVLVALAQRPGQAGLLIAPAILVGSAAVMRTLVFLTGHAPFVPQFIVPEAVMAGLLFAAARARGDEVGETVGATS
jgi:hydrogenase/urease accessory protein HupE